jgi:hypothetical protein
MMGCSIGRSKHQRNMSAALISGAMLTTALSMTLTGTGDAAAAIQTLDCVLSNPGGPPDNPSIAVTIDDTGKTLKVQRGTDSYSFTNVSISNISISGQVNDVSLGIDRSSLGIVWQQYGADKVATDFGQCRVSDQASSSGSH